MDGRFRHELKFTVNAGDVAVLRSRLGAYMARDSHNGGVYKIRSLYFDNLSNQALREKVDGVNRREKFRMRYYNGDLSQIHLEKKSKYNGLGTKDRAILSAQEAQRIVDGDLEWMLSADRPLVQELYVKMKNGGFRPKTIVDYTREPFVYAPGNVRVTLDYNIRTGLQCTDFLNADCVTIPVGEHVTILEVKWDEFLPSVIRDAVQLGSRQTTSFSKYAACRMYG